MKKKLGVYVSVKREGYDPQAFNLVLSFVWKEDDEGKITNATDSFGATRPELDSLQLVIYGGKHYEKPQISSPYVSLYYNHPCADLTKVERAAKGMRRIESKVAKMQESEGMCDWIGAVSRYCRAAGAEFAAHHESGNRIETIGGLTYTLKRMFEAHCEAHDLTAIEA